MIVYLKHTRTGKRHIFLRGIKIYHLTLEKKRKTKFSPISISRKLLKVPGHTTWRLERLWHSVKA